MKPFSEFHAEPRTERSPQLPAGAYVCVIQGVREEGDFPDDSIVLRLEIAEGDWAGYYARRYKNESEAAALGHRDYEPRYKGDFRIRVPRAENPHIKNRDWAIRNFNNSIWAIEDSNAGYHFDFGNTAALKGKTVGISVREAEYQGNPFTEIGRLESARMVREGKISPMKPRGERASAQASAPAGGAPGAAEAPAGWMEDEPDDLPF